MNSIAFLLLLANLPSLPVSPQTTDKVSLEVLQYLLQVFVHDSLVVWNDGRPDAGHSRLDPRIGVILVPVQPGNNAGKEWSQLVLGLICYLRETKCCSLHSNIVESVLLAAHKLMSITRVVTRTALTASICNCHRHSVCILSMLFHILYTICM